MDEILQNYGIGGVHPLAARYRMIPDAELDDLISDIRRDGFDRRFPIILDGEVLLDGRNRLRACAMAEAAPVFRQFDDDWEGSSEDRDDAIKRFILRVNNNRRHMNAGQRAIMVALAYPNPQQGKHTSTEIVEVHAFTLSQARTIVNSAPDLVDQVIAGGMYFNNAFEEGKRRREQAEKVEANMKRLQDHAPDLHNIVLEEKGMTAAEAIAALDARIKAQSDAEATRKAQEAAAEENKRETLLRLSEAAYRGVLAWAAEGFASDVSDRLSDDEFRRRLIERLRFNPSDVAEIKHGADALTTILARIAKGKR